MELPCVSIGAFEAPSTVLNDEWFNLKATISHHSTTADFVNATVELSGEIILKWDAATDEFTKYQDIQGYCDLASSGSEKTTIDSTSYELKWNIKLSANYPAGLVDVISTSTKVYDSSDHSASGSQTGLFTFQHTGDEPSTGGTTPPYQPPAEPPEWPGLPELPPDVAAPVNLALVGVVAIVLIVVASAVGREVGLGKTRSSWRRKRRGAWGGRPRWKKPKPRKTPKRRKKKQVPTRRRKKVKTPKWKKKKPWE